MIANDLIKKKSSKIQCLICDVDGVLTDGYIDMACDGSESRVFHVHDGMGLKFLMFSGIQVAIITTSKVPVIDHRMKQLGITHYYRGQVSKIAAYQNLKEKLQLPDEAFAYIGDDLPDWEIMQHVGLSIAVADAVDPLIQRADWVTQKKGGRGAVREVCDTLMQWNQTTDKALQIYLNQSHAKMPGDTSGAFEDVATRDSGSVEDKDVRSDKSTSGIPGHSKQPEAFQ